MSNRDRLVLLALSALLAPAALSLASPPIVYPDTRKQDLVEDLHGTKVADPYRWLEDDNSAETKAWVEAENKVTFAYLKAIPQREGIEKRLTKLWNYEKFTTPGKEGGKYFFSKNDGLQPQSVLYVLDALDGTPRALLDPNSMSKDGTVALAGTGISDDGKFMAYGIAEAGSDWNKWKVRDVQTGKDLADELNWLKFSGASWTKDNKGFFYSRYDEPKAGAALTQLNKFPKVFYHTMGQSQGQDVLIYERPDEPDWGFGAGVTDDGRFLTMNVSQGTDRKNRFFYRDLKATPINYKAALADTLIREAEYGIGKNILRNDEPADIAAAKTKTAAEDRASRAERVKANGGSAHGFVELLPDFDASYDLIDNDGGVLFFNTDLNAPRGRVIAIDTAKPDRANWKELIPQSADSIQGVSVVGNHFIVNYLKDAHSVVKIFDLTGKFVREVDLPGIGTASGFGGKRNDPETFYTFTSYIMPAAVYRYDVASGKSTLFRSSKVDFNPDDYTTKQVFYTSKDGVRVPMFITSKKSIALDGKNPTLLYGYGGFAIPMTPGFSPATIVWLEMGGVYAVANIRGGSEYGEDWHQGGTKLNKQNVFNDFIAAGEWLIANKYTQSSKLAIQGGSNGGLLVGACITQRPDLFGAALPAVGVMDMLRFHKFTIGWAWASDYGNADDAEQFKALYAYSPYHQLLRASKDAKYPATLVTTADHDDRVVPAHSFKFAAALQAAQTGDAPVLIRIETRAGHGAGKPTAKRIEEVADLWAFLVKNLNVEGKVNP